MTGLFKNKEKQVQRVVLIETSLIIPNRSQPRVTFSDEELSCRFNQGEWNPPAHQCAQVRRKLRDCQR